MVQAEIERARAELASGDLLRAKRAGWGDDSIGAALGVDGPEVRRRRHEQGIMPAFRRVDSCAGEVAAGSNYFYSTWGEADEAPPAAEKPRVVIIGSGPNRIGQGIEFDYCCVHAAQTFRELGYEAVMVNCNPETVSTDYDTSDRLYFEPLSPEEVLAVCDREQPVGVVTQFGGQTPLRLARHIEEAGYRILGTPHAAIDLAEDRERFGSLVEELGVRCPPWAIASNVEEALAAAAEIGYPVLVRPSYVLGGRAMRVCYDDEQLEAGMAAVHGPVLLDRFVEHAIELDVDALCDGEEVYIAAVMQHVEEAGVHSGDSACVLPAPSLTLAAALEVEHVVKRLGPALGVVGLLNVQLAIADSVAYVLEANPRASRTVPFASKAIGINLVEAACRLAAGATLRELDLPVPRPAQVSVKAAVLPFSRFPGADPVLGPEMRSTGEVMASAADLPTALAKAERAAGRPLPTSGTAFLSVRDEDKPAAVAVAAALAGLGLRAGRDGGHRANAPRRGARDRGDREGRGRSGRRGDRRRSRPSRPLRPRDQHAAGERGPRRRLPHPRGRPRRARAVRDDDLRRCGGRARDRERAGGVGALAAGAHRERGVSEAAATSPRDTVSPGARRARLRVAGTDSVGPYTLLRLERGEIEPGIPGQFFMLEAPGRLLPRPMSLCLAPPGELAFLMEPIGPGTSALCALEPGDAIHVFGPLGNGFDLDVARPLLVGGGIGIAPLPYLAETLGGAPALLGFRSERHAEAAHAASRRPGRRRAAARDRADPRGRRRRPRVRARADARGRSRAPPGRPARMGGPDGLRIRRVLRLRRERRWSLRPHLHRGTCAQVICTIAQML